jgi:hypothetical protein
MRASYFMGCIVLFFGTLATSGSPGTATLSTMSTGSITQREITHPTRTIAENLPVQGSARIPWGRVPRVSINQNIAVGEKLPVSVKLRPIPNHETYRYAIVNNHRVIVDAASREIIYVVQ